MNDVPVGTYTGVTITLGTATLGYLNTTAPPPTINTEPATAHHFHRHRHAQPIPWSSPHAGAPVGLRMDFDLHKSIQVDSNGNITGTVNPTFDVSTVARTDPGAYIDEFDRRPSSASTPPASRSSSKVRTASSSPSTSTARPSGMATPASARSPPAASCRSPARSIPPTKPSTRMKSRSFPTRASTLAARSPTSRPPTGAATSFDLYVRGLLPTSTGVQLGQIAQVNLTGNEIYSIYWMHNPFTQFLFNSSGLVAGQSVAIGGPATGAANASAVTVKRVALRDWGFNGTIVAGSQSSANGSFQMQINGFAGVLIPQTVTVYLGANCDFRYGLGAFTDLANGANIRVVGLLLKNPTNGQLVLLARHFDGLNFTDFTTVAYQ